MARPLQAAKSNVANEVIAAYAVEIGRATRDLDEASGRRRAVLKRAKSAGVDTKSLLEVLALKKLDEEAVQAQMRNVLRYASVIAPGIPLGQADLFDSAANPKGFGDAPGRPLNAKAQATLQAHEAEQKGYDCGLNGGSMDDAGYAPGSPAHGHFREGYFRGQAVIAERMGEHAKQADSSLKKRRTGKTANSHSELRGAAAGDDHADDVGEPLGSA